MRSSSMGRINYPIYEMENNRVMFQTTNQAIAILKISQHPTTWSISGKKKKRSSGMVLDRMERLSSQVKTEIENSKFYLQKKHLEYY